MAPLALPLVSLQEETSLLSSASHRRPCFMLVCVETGELAPPPPASDPASLNRGERWDVVIVTVSRLIGGEFTQRRDGVFVLCVKASVGTPGSVLSLSLWSWSRKWVGSDWFFVSLVVCLSAILSSAGRSVNFDDVSNASLTEI